MKMEKLLFDSNGAVAGVNLAKTKKEVIAEELAAADMRRKIKLEQKRWKMKEGLIPQGEIDSDIDGLSSLDSFDEEFGIRGYNP